MTSEWGRCQFVSQPSGVSPFRGIHSTDIGWPSIIGGSRTVQGAKAGPSPLSFPHSPRFMTIPLDGPPREGEREIPVSKSETGPHKRRNPPQVPGTRAPDDSETLCLM
jgi:hypothetical protein